MRKLPLHIFFIIIILSSCGQNKQLKSFNNVLSSDDSLSIELGNAKLKQYHSEALNLDITYPDYLRHQFLPEDQMEVFMTNDVSISFMVQDFSGEIYRTPGQTLMGMGAELLEATDNYSIHKGHEDDIEYYSKVIDDSTRMITIILRYGMNHTEAAEPLRQYVHDYMP